MRRILVLADIFPPHFAPRSLSMVQRWVEEGNYVELFTEDIQQWSSNSHGRVFTAIPDPCCVHRLPLRKKYNRIESLQELFFSTKSRQFQALIEEKVDVASFDLIIAFAYRNFPLGVAHRLGVRYNKPVICDCRDIIEQYPKYQFLPQSETAPSFLKKGILQILKHLFIRQRNRILRKVDAVTTVSPWHREQLQQIVGRIPVRLFYNGYDSRLFVAQKVQKGEKLRIIFTGRFLSEQLASPSFFLDSLASSKLRSIVESGDLEVAWFVDKVSAKILRGMLEKYPRDLQKLHKIEAMRPFQQVPSLLSSSSLVLLLADPNNEQHIVSTKIFEAMAVERPIVLVQSDRSLRAALLEQSEMGWAIENEKELVEIIKSLYLWWQKNEWILPKKGNKDFVASFSREKIATEYAVFAEEIISQREKKYDERE